MSTASWRGRGVSAGIAALVGIGTCGALAGPAQAAPGFVFDQRVAGANRVETAVAASKALYPADDSAAAVVVVNQNSVVDGLSAAYAAGVVNAPILYTDTDRVPAATAAEIERLGAVAVIIVGGASAVSPALEAAWKADEKEVERLAGRDRYETAAAVATWEEGYVPERVFIASGASVADALAAGPLAYARNYPILLTRTDGVPASTAEALKKFEGSARTVLGGTGAVSESTYTALGGSQRLGGASRQETAVLVANHAVTLEFFDPNSIALVGGANGNAVDALVAAPLAGSRGVPVLFVQGNDAVGTVTADHLRSRAASLTGEGHVFGGPAAVTANAVAQANAAAGGS
ncbi:hypothetical protein NUM3379_14140 [Kineococcus sp. NUM-3379]